MSLRFILGNVGTGKTNLCLDEIIEKDNSFNNLIYIVPEQFSIESEKNLLAKKVEGSIINTGVFSFKHLAFQAMRKLGVENKNILSDIGKLMLLKKSILDVEDELKLYKKSVNKRGFIDSMSSTISELLQYNINDILLNATIENLEESNLKDKLHDIEKIFSAYNNNLSDKYIFAENTLEILSEILPSYPNIKNTEIWIDGFKSFTPQEYKVITKLMICCKKVNITLNIDANNPNIDSISQSDNFYETKSTLAKLIDIAKANNIKIIKPTLLKRFYRFKDNAELEFLAKNYFSLDNKSFNKDCNHIKIFNCFSKYDEADIVCSSITKLVRDFNYKYSDIAIIIGSTDYETPLANCMIRYGIPNFIDNRKNINSHPLTQVIKCIVDISANNWKSSSIFKLLKTGYLNIDPNEIYLLENYVISQNIDGSDWCKEWKYGFDENTYNRECICKIKDTVVDYISTFTNKIKQNKIYFVDDISKAIFEFLGKIKAQNTLIEEIQTAKDNNDLENASIHEQIWNTLCEIFDEMSEFLGKTKLTSLEYFKILETATNNATIGIIPALSDQLIVGDMERTRLSDIKALFVLGVNDGIIPPQRDEVGIFTDLERLAIKKNYFDLAPDIVSKLYQDRLNVYSTLTKPSKYLYLSYTTSDKLNPSIVINKLKGLYPKLQIEDYVPVNNLKDADAPIPTLNKLIEVVSENNDISDIEKDILGFYYNSNEYKEIIKNIEYILSDISEDYIDNELIEELYGNTINSSVSRLETFVGCPYSFFLKYCLKSNERNEFKFDKLMSGNIYHGALDNIFRKIKADNIDIANIDDNDIKELINFAIDNSITQNKKETYKNVPRYVGYFSRMKQTLEKILIRYSNEAKNSKFKPQEFELTFGSRNGINPITYQLDSGCVLNLTGKIDRIDHLDTPNTTYVRIIDYKLSGKDFDFNKLYYGISLQLPLYLNSYIDILKKNTHTNYEPAGILYYPIKVSTIENVPAKSTSKESFYKTMRYVGIILDDDNVKDATKDYFKTVRKPNKNIINADEFKNLKSFVDKKIVEIGNDIMSGNIKVSPYKLLSSTGTIQENSCAYCKYRNICKIDLNNDIDKYRILRLKSDRYKDIID